MQHPEESIALENAELQRTGRRRKRLSVSKRIPEQECIDRLNAIEGRKFVRWVGEYVGSGKSISVMRCNCGYEWEAYVGNLTKGGRCPKCVNHYTYTESERIEQIRNIEGVDFVGWHSFYENAFSKAIVRCLVDGHQWVTTVDGLVNAKKGCPKCGGVYRYTEKERVNQINSLNNIRFVKWVVLYKNQKSKAIVKCLIDGHEWPVSVASIVKSNGSGFPKCSKVYRYTEQERIHQINSIDNVEFVDWIDNYKNSHSKVIVKCSNNHQWASSITDLIHGGYGCSTCAQHGFSRSMHGTLYLLRSECGQHVKVGISNKHKQRISDLSRGTPFGFEVIELYHNEDGKEIARLEKEFHGKYESAGFKGFDGATEWLKFSPELLEEFRLLGE